MNGVIFDLDGTLIDSMDVWEKVDHDLLAMYGCVPDKEYMGIIASLNIMEAVNYIIAKFQLKRCPEDVIEDINSLAYMEYSKNIRLKPGAKELLLCLKSKDMRIAVATASFRHMCEAVLKNNGVYDLFDELVFSQEVGENKSGPKVFLETAKKIGVSPKNCIVFEDSVHAAGGAKSAGMHVIGVYDKHWEEQMPEMKKICHGYVYNLFDAMDICKYGKI